jgi:hypothetical protein
MDKFEIPYESAADDLAQMKTEKPKLLVIDDQAINVRLMIKADVDKTKVAATKTLKADIDMFKGFY